MTFANLEAVSVSAWKCQVSLFSHLRKTVEQLKTRIFYSIMISMARLPMLSHEEDALMDHTSALAGGMNIGLRYLANVLARRPMENSVSGGVSHTVPPHPALADIVYPSSAQHLITAVIFWYLAIKSFPCQ